MWDDFRAILSTSSQDKADHFQELRLDPMIVYDTIKVFINHP